MISVRLFHDPEVFFNFPTLAVDPDDFTDIPFQICYDCIKPIIHGFFINTVLVQTVNALTCKFPIFCEGSFLNEASGIILIFSFLFLHKKPRAADIAVVIATLAGVSLFFFDSLDAGRLVGNLLGITAGAFMGGMFVAVGNTKGEEKMSGILLGHLFCAAVGLPFAAFTENTFDSTGVAILALLGVVQLGIPYILYALATLRCNAITCSVLAAIEPLLNPVWVALAGGGVPGPLALLGGVFLIAVITAYSVYDHKTSVKVAA